MAFQMYFSPTVSNCRHCLLCFHQQANFSGLWEAALLKEALGCSSFIPSFHFQGKGLLLAGSGIPGF